jgi:hypothetical protein
MSRNPFSAVLAVATVVLALAGCAFTGAYNPAYLSAARRPAAVQADGRVLVVTTAEDDAYVYAGRPTSFTGSATTLTLPLGSIVRESAKAAFADTFRGGADAASAVAQAERYAVIVAPKLTSFTYEYNQLKNAGFAITPTAAAVVDVRVMDAGGGTRWQRTYSSGPVEGASYMLNTSPHEEISKVAHKALYDLFAAAAADVARGVTGKPATAPVQ